MIGTMRILFTTVVAGLEAKFGLIDVSDYLDIVGCLDELNSGQSTWWNNSCAVRSGRAERDKLLFFVRHGLVSVAAIG